MRQQEQKASPRSSTTPKTGISGNAVDMLATSAKPSSPAISEASTISALQLVLKIERDARQANTIGELVYLIANDTRKLINARQVFVVAKAAGSTSFRVTGISSLTNVDRTSPAVLWIERVLKRLAATKDGLDVARNATLASLCEANDPNLLSYPFRELRWVPLKNKKGSLFAGILLARETAWGDSDLLILTRISETFGHAWQALLNKPQLELNRILQPRAALAAAAILALLALMPVPLTALAPAEVVAEAPVVVAAPIEGVIDEVLVNPNEPVKTGDVLFRFNAVQARNAFAIAEKEVSVADAKLRQISQTSFIDPTAKRELAVAQADLALKQADRDLARDILDRSTVRAEHSGLAVFADKRELVGRPVTVGQRIMDIADPKQITFKINVPVDDAVVLEPGSKVRVFLDNDPLNPLIGHVARASFSARPTEANQLAFRVDADPVKTSGPLPRLGLRGTAQLYGSNVALGYYLFRRPLAFVRQKLGI